MKAACRATRRLSFHYGAMRRVIAHAPTRIDFGGGWTDVPPYPEEEGGRVCNVAINRYAVVQVDEAPAGDHEVRAAADEPIAQAALRRLGVTGVRTTMRSDFPTGAGLGGSSAVGIASVAALSTWLRRPIDNLQELVEQSRALEIEDLGIAGGWQDHYAAAHGGALDLTFGAATTVRPLHLDAQARSALEERCLVIYTGQSRISGETISGVLTAYRQGERGVVEALRQMADLAADMCVALSGGDLDALSDLVDEHWVHQRLLHPAITTDRIDAIAETARRHGARGVKALGASGGGCVAILAPSHAIDAVRHAVEPLGRLLPFEVDTRGVRVEEVNA